MKTTIFFAFVLLLNCQALFAQPNMSIGIIGSPMTTNFWDSPQPNPIISSISLPTSKKFMSAYSVGASFRLGLQKHIFLQSELTYERKGFGFGEIEFTDFNGAIIGKSHEQNQLNYVVLAPSIGFMSSGDFHFEGSIGIFGGYLTSVVSKMVDLPPDLPSNSPIFSSSISNTKIEDFNRTDYGLTSRLGVGWDLGRSLTVTINAVGNFGFATLPNAALLNNIIPYKNDKSISFGLQFGAFYNF
jgi:hypothetical protein